MAARRSRPNRSRHLNPDHRNHRHPAPAAGSSGDAASKRYKHANDHGFTQCNRHPQTDRHAHAHADRYHHPDDHRNGAPAAHAHLLKTRAARSESGRSRLTAVKSKLVSRSPVFWFFIVLAGIAAVTLVSPAEKVLGANARIVYLHGAWVWAALAAFIAAGVVGAAALAMRLADLHAWSRALGRTGLFFWITYLPISMWAMQTNWNGLYLAEPRFRLAVIFSVTGVLLQAGLALLDRPAWISAANIAYAAALFFAIATTQNVMHPPSPMLDSDAGRIQLYFATLVALTLLAAWQVARWWRRLDPTV